VRKLSLTSSKPKIIQNEGDFDEVDDFEEFKNSLKQL
jgi:hypothetical protein